MQPSIGILLRELSHLYTQAQREPVNGGHDTSSTQSHVLMELGQNGLLTQQELGRRLGLDKGWISRAVESLVQGGLVAKSRHDNDRRSRWLQLTSQGSLHYQELTASLDSQAEQMMQHLNPDQRIQLHHALLLLMNCLQGHTPEPGGETGNQLLEKVRGEPAPRNSEPAHTPASMTVRPTEDVIAAAYAALDQVVESATQAARLAEPVPAADAIPSYESVTDVAIETAAPVARSETVHRGSASPAVNQTRIVGSKTLPSRPLLSRQLPKTPLSRQSGGGVTANPAKSAGHIVLPSAPTVPIAPLVAAPIVPPAAAATERQAIAPPLVAAPRPTPAKPAAPIGPGSDNLASAEPQRGTGSIFQKLLSQGNLFNKFLQREAEPATEPVVEAAPVDIAPIDNIQFQSASPTDWNEIRNLLTANRLPAQGAVNHLTNFLVATENGRVIGTIGMEQYGDIGLVRSLVVASPMRGRSIGKRLVKQLIERARVKQVSMLYLLSGPADRIYTRFGFESMARADLPTRLYTSTELQDPSSTASTAMRRKL